ncbi:MAG TPA: T9SS type A sorting domain-containing protein [Chitinivibrionales bacterium]|nr:T9SS type A sorting domain-containing protein [Chitinivibrionales bacterium]
MRLRLKVALAATVCVLSVSYLSAAIPPGYTGTPFSFDTLKGHPQGIPGVVKGVFFDNGGEGVAYHDVSPGNTGGTMRLNASGQQIQADINVDMQSYSGNDWDVVGYGTNDHFDSSVNAAVTTWHLSWIDQDNPAVNPPIIGDWLKFTVNVNTAGTYYIDFKQATANAPPNLQTLTFYDGASVRVDSINNLPACITPQGCPEVWHAWTVNMHVDSVDLDTGLQVIQLNFHVGSWNYDWMRFTLKNASTVACPKAQTRPDQGFNIRPVLAGNNLNVTFSLAKPGRTRLEVFDCSGRSMLQGITKNLAAGNQKQVLNLGTLGQGVYILRLEQNGLKTSAPFTVR